ncbi:MAG: NAD(P)/FAD-dependent oxidoreductase [Rubrobacteraceae bacterium]
MAKTTVIGAGIVGASVAYFLSEKGASVVLLDASEPASGTTSTSFAWVNANNKTPKEYFDLNVAGMNEHIRLRDEFGGGAWLHETGNIIVAGEGNGDELSRRVERLRSWEYAAEMKTAAEANADLEPDISFPNPETPVAHFPDETWADAPRLALELVDSARKNGAETRFGEAVKSIETEEGRFAVHLESGGDYVEADIVVNAAGPKADVVADMVGRSLPLDVFFGLLVRVDAPENSIRRLIHTPTVNLRPDGDGYILLHHDSVDERLTDDFAGVEDPLCRELLERATRLVPTLENASVVEARFGFRPVPGDGYSCVGAVPSVPGYYEAVTHSGVTLGPIVGRLLADEILDGKVDSLLAPFRPGRFS